MDYWTPARALVVAAHPDDIEFGVRGEMWPVGCMRGARHLCDGDQRGGGVE